MNTEAVYTSEATLTVLLISKDGNCLFAALVDQLRRLHLDRRPDLTPSALRASVVQFYQAHLPFYLDGLYAQACSQFPDLVAVSSIRELVDRFLAKLGEDGYWGGQETINAVSQIYNHSIMVFREDGQGILFNAPAASSGIAPIHIVHRLSWESEQYYHYDSVLTVQRGNSFIFIIVRFLILFPL